MCGMLSASGLLGQTSHRQPDPKPPREPNIFDQLEKQRAESPKELAAREAAARARSANIAELTRELPRLIQLAQDLRERLNATDLKTTLPVDLERQAKQLEQAARQIHKRIREL